MKTSNLNLKTKKTKRHYTMYVFFILTTLLLFLDRYTNLYINTSSVHFLLLFTEVALFVIIIAQFFNKLKSTKSTLTTLLVVGLLCFLKAFFTWGGDWKTETILYENKSNPNKTIEYQLRGDRFAFGFKKRTIERFRIFPFIDWISDVNIDEIEESKWENIQGNQ